jgi:hypothetical protein
MFEKIKTNFQKIRATIQDWTSRILERASDEQAISENELRERCCQDCPGASGLWEMTFWEMLFSALLQCKLDFSLKWQGDQVFFYGIRFRDTNPTVRRGQSARRSAQVSIASKSSASPYGILQGYIMSAPDSMVSVSRLRKLYKAVASEDDVPFSEFLQDILDKNRTLSQVTKTNKKTGKNLKYIDGLMLTRRGKQFLEERTL